MSDTARVEADLADLGRIAIDLRIGVTGHRWIPVDNSRVREVARAALVDLAARADALTTAATSVGVTIVSALAEGADRLVAELALQLGARLEVVLPLPIAEYEKDFTEPASRAHFHQLLDRAASVDVVDPTWTRDHQYRSAGLAMVDRIDVLVAIYDGHKAKGTGGTAEIVDYAQQLPVPVVELRARRSEGGIEVAPPCQPADLSRVPMAPAAFARLDHFNRVQLRGKERANADEQLSAQPDNGFLPVYLRADQLAIRYQALHKTAVRLLYVLSAAAVTAVSTQLIFFHDRHWLAWLEFGLLVTLVTTMVAARQTHLLGNWTSARSIAERMRSAMFLSKIGETPFFAYVPTGGGDEDESGAEWASRAVRDVWFRLAHEEKASADETADALSKTRWIDAQWLVPQLQYHELSLRRWSRRQFGATLTAIVLFGLSVLASFAHSMDLLPEDSPDFLAWVSIVVPAIGAAISGYAAQREFGRQAMRSRRVLRDLRKLQPVLNAAQTPSEVRSAARQLDSLVHGDAAEWYSAVNLHEPEIP